MEKVTFITTTKNDEKGVEMLFSSLLMQTKLPDEIIIVDAESSDKTKGVLKKFEAHFKKKKIPITVINQECNRAQGRNIAIKKASHKIIAVSDAGCVLSKEWLKNITEPFVNKSVAVVSGYYNAGDGTVFQKCLAAYTCVMPDKLTSDFLPSSRSVAFRKSSWENVKGYPEELDTCEDLVFARNMRNAGLTFFLQKEAVVTWPQKKTLFAAAKQFFSYARGDGQALYIRPQTPLLFGRYLVGILMFFAGFLYAAFWMLLGAGLLLYIFWAISKNYKYVQDIHAIYLLPLLQFVSDFAVIAGMKLGVADRAPIAKGTLWQVLGKISTSLFGLIAFSLLARSLSPTLMSSYTYIISMSALLMTVSDFGMDTLITRESSKNNNGIVSYYLGLRVILSVLLIFFSVIAGLSAPFIIASTGHMFFLLTNGYIAYAKGEKNFFKATALQTSIAFITLCAIVGGVITNVSTYDFISLGTVASLIGLLFVKKNISISISLMPLKKLYSLFMRTLPLGIAALISLAYLKLDVFFLGYYFPPNTFPDVGLYAIAYRPFELAIVIGGLYTQTLLPYITNKLNDSAFIINSGKKTLFISMVLGMLLFFGAPAIIHLIGGQDYGASVQALRILSVAAMGTILAGFAYAIVIAKKREKFILVVSLMTLVVNIVMNYLLIPSYSYIGASWATLVSQMTLCVGAVGAAVIALRAKNA